MDPRRVKAEETIAPNLIPMVDIMFLLLLFFMLGADMGQRELEDVKLPLAEAATVDRALARVNVNVYHDAKACPEYAARDLCSSDAHWRIAVRGVDYTPENVGALLAREADLEQRDPAHPER